MTDTENLIDYALIETAARRLESAKDRLGQAETGLAAAQVTAKRAAEASRMAVAGVGDVDAMTAENFLEQAAKELRVAQKIRDAATDAHTSAELDARTAHARAHAPLFFAGIRARAAATAKHERARATMAEAEQEFAAANGLIDQADRNGMPAHLPQPMRHHRLDRTEQRPTDFWTVAREQAAWASVRVDVEKQTSPWLDQFAGSN